MRWPTCIAPSECPCVRTSLSCVPCRNRVCRPPSAPFFHACARGLKSDRNRRPAVLQYLRVIYCTVHPRPLRDVGPAGAEARGIKRGTLHATVEIVKLSTGWGAHEKRGTPLRTLKSVYGLKSVTFTGQRAFLLAFQALYRNLYYVYSMNT